MILQITECLKTNQVFYTVDFISTTTNAQTIWNICCTVGYY